MTVAIIDYGSGNLRSVAKALEYVADESTRITVTQNPKDLEMASHIVLPGVGAFGDCMRGLTSISGMREALEENVRTRKKPFLGICVGMQMLFDKGYEHGEHAGLGWLEGEVVSLSGQRSEVSDQKFSNINSPDHQPPTTNHLLKIPHMGWNDLTVTGNHPLMKDIRTGDHAYFVHSYHAQVKNPSDIAAITEYGQAVTASVARDNIMGTQFHPEKSQATGLSLLANFLRL